MQILYYDPKKGIFTNLVTRSSKSLKGMEAGHLVKTIGYWSIFIEGQHYKRSRLAWFYMTGTWPDEIDHVNQNKLDDRWENLRESSHSLNQHNRSYKRNRDLSQGVYRQRSGRFCCQCMVDRKRVCLGTYDTEQEAAEVYQFYRNNNVKGL